MLEPGSITGRLDPWSSSAQEVLQLLRPHRPHDDRVARTDAVRQAAARPSTWLANFTKLQRRELGPLADRLPSLLFRHAAGGVADDLLRRFGGWSTWRYERALEAAGSCIASHLNRG